jgi:hypothetical protein
MSPSSRLVTRILFRIYRPVVLWLLCVMVVCAVVAMTVVTGFTDPPFSLWLLVVGLVAKYWLLVVGTMLVSMHLRQFVSNGVTRRDFIVGGAAFGLVVVVAFAALVPIGHGVEQALLSLGGSLSPDYPRFSAGTAVREFGNVLPGQLAFFGSGLAISAGFYRYGGWPGILFLVPGAIPLAIAEGLLGIDEKGHLETRLVPYGVALLVTLAATALVALLYYRATRDVAIRRAAG